MSPTVLIADDQALVRVGLRTILENEPDITVVGEAVDGAEAYQLTRSHRPDVVLMDVHMPVLDGIDATRRIVESGLPSRVLVLTTFDLDSYVYERSRPGPADSSSRTCQLTNWCMLCASSPVARASWPQRSPAG